MIDSLAATIVFAFITIFFFKIGFILGFIVLAILTIIAVSVFVLDLIDILVKIRRI
jgi:hypothetical protein